MNSLIHLFAELTTPAPDNTVLHLSWPYLAGMAIAVGVAVFVPFMMGRRNQSGRHTARLTQAPRL